MTLSADGFFDSELIARLGRLELIAKRIVDGFLAGKNRSSRHGFSVEFVEHREYSPGDDLRDMLADYGCAGKTIGIEYHAYGLTAQ